MDCTFDVRGSTALRSHAYGKRRRIENEEASKEGRRHSIPQAPPARIGKWSLTSLQQRLVKTGGRLIQHARYYWLLLAESHLTRRLFGNMLQKIAALPSPVG
jgi:hypothetical protein